MVPVGICQSSGDIPQEGALKENFTSKMLSFTNKEWDVYAVCVKKWKIEPTLMLVELVIMG